MIESHFPASIAWSAQASGLAWVTGLLIKKTAKRPRPFQMENFPAPLVTAPIDDSMPSVHAATTSALFFSLWLLESHFAPLAGLWATLAGASRVYLGVHFLSDILVGYALGLGTALTIWIWLPIS